MPKTQYNPTPDEIKEMCLEIQKGWDEETRLNRLHYLCKRDRVSHWTPPVISISDYGAAIQEHSANAEHFDLW